jgi:hypothetical protein
MCAPEEPIMKKLTMGFLLLLGLLLLATPLLVVGEGEAWEVNWWTVDGGGGRSAGDDLSVTGTFGQPDAQGRAAAGDFAVSGGFWSAPAPPLAQPPSFLVFLPTTVAAPGAGSPAR